MIVRIIRKALRVLKMKRSPIEFARSIGVTIGNDCLIIDLTEKTFGSEPYLISLGNHVEVGSGARFMTHDGGAWVLRLDDPNTDLIAPISVGDNVLIGVNVVIMPGVHIGSNCIIAAGAVVTRDVPEGMVFGGVPAKPIKRIAEYRIGALSRALQIKGLSAEAKRSYLLQKFNLKEHG